MPYVVEMFQEFVERRGCKPIQIGSRWVFPDGATSNGSEHHEPPDDPSELVRIQHEYWNFKLTATIKRYNQAREAIQMQIQTFQMGAGPPPDQAFGPDWKEDMQRHAAEIAEMRATVQRLAAQLETRKTVQHHDSLNAERQRRAAKALQEVAALPTF